MTEAQYFTQEKFHTLTSEEIYHWTRYYVKRDNPAKTTLYPYFITVDEARLCFWRYEYKEKSRSMLKDLLLEVPLVNPTFYSGRVQNKLRNLFDQIETKRPEFHPEYTIISRAPQYDITENTSSSSHFFREFFLDFLWDLKVNHYFDQRGRREQIIDALSHIPLLTAIGLKLLFYEYVLNYSPYIEINPVAHKEIDIARTISSKMSHGEPLEYGIHGTLKEARETACSEWIDFLTDERNEVLFHDKRIETTQQHWLDTTEEELNRTFSAIRKQTIPITHAEIQNRKVSRYYLKRYSFESAVRFFSPLGLRWYWIVPAFLLSMIGLVIWDWGSFNYSNDGYEHSSLISIYVLVFLGLPVVIWLLQGISVLWLEASWKYFGRHKRGELIGSRYNSFLHKLKDSVSVLIPQIFLPRMTIAIISGWLIFFTSEELVRIDMELDGRSLLFIIILVLSMMAVFMYNEVRNIAPSLRRKKVYTRIFTISGLAFLISYSIGYTIMPFSNKFIEKSDLLYDSYVPKQKMQLLRAEMDTLQSNILFIDEYENLLHSFGQLSGLEKSELQLYGTSFWLKYANPSLNAIFLKTSEKEKEELASETKEKLNKRALELKKLSEKNQVYADSLIKEATFYDTIPITKKSLYATLINLDEYNRRSIQKVVDLKIMLEMKYARASSSAGDLINQDSLIKLFQNDRHRVAKMDENSLFARIQDTIHRNDREKQPPYLALNMLMFRTVIALFIGVVLQLIIQDKAITEPL